MGPVSKQICVVIGASHAGVNFAFALRKEGWLGRVLLFDADPEIPYHRPPMSKAFLTCEGGIKNFLLKPAQAYEKENIELHLGTTIKEINKVEKFVVVENGNKQSYDQLVLATGSRPFVPPISGFRPGSELAFSAYGCRWYEN